MMTPEVRKAYNAAYYARNRERIAARQAEYQKENSESLATRQVWYRKENAERLAAQKAVYYQENHESIAAYREENRESIAASAARYCKDHPEKNQAKSRKRRALKFGACYVEHDTPMPADGRCPYCRVLMTGKYPETTFPSIDHIIPLSRGGHHAPDNTMRICLKCNMVKGGRPSLTSTIKQVAL